MYHPIEIPFGCVMLFNVVDLKEGVTVEDVELALGEMCNVVKNTYGDDKGGFIAGQVYRYSGFVSEEGSIGEPPAKNTTAAKIKQGELAIVTFWQSFEQHEKSHADRIFREKFQALADFCDETYELGYQMLWQGVPEDA
jgi:hypothetical protein